MEILKQGNKDAVDKYYFECARCGCAFAAEYEELEELGSDRKVKIYHSFGVECPCCCELQTTDDDELDKRHKRYLEWRMSDHDQS